jgi:hypothetical protein
MRVLLLALVVVAGGSALATREELPTAADEQHERAGMLCLAWRDARREGVATAFDQLDPAAPAEVPAGGHVGRFLDYASAWEFVEHASPECYDGGMASDSGGVDRGEIGVAFSFLDEDLKVASALADKLRERMSVYVYTQRQEELAGRDGIAEFTSVFKERARLVVILYRRGWGETPWTRIEKTAITDRGLKKGWDFVFAVALGSSPEGPPFLPETRIWYGLDHFGLDGAVATIDARYQELGGSIRVETAREKAQRLAEVAERRRRHDAWLDTEEARQAADEEFETMVRYWSSEAATMPTGFSVQRDRWTVFIQSTPATLVARWNSGNIRNSIRDGEFLVSLYAGRVFFMGSAHQVYSPGGPGVTPGSCVLERSYCFRLDDAGTRGWVDTADDGRFYSSTQLADRLLHQLVETAYDPASH